DLEADELLDEKSALTGLVFTGERTIDKRSVIDTYTFPNQECELRPGNQIKNKEGKSAGDIVELDEVNNIIRLKKGPSIKDNHPAIIIKFENISTKDKEESLIQFAEWLLENGFINDLPNYKVTRNLLLSSAPSVTIPVV